MRTLTDEQIAFYNKNGYLHIQNILTDDEVSKLKTACRRKIVGDIAGYSEFNNFTLQKKIVDIVKDILGEDVIYPGMSFTRTNDFPDKHGSRIFHNDVVYEEGTYSHNYPIIHVGFYLQDQKEWSGALKVKPGSQFKPCFFVESISNGLKKAVQFLLKGEVKNAMRIFDFSKSVNVPSMPHDMIIWNTCLHHAGYGMRPKMFPFISLHPLLENHLPSWVFRPLNKERDLILAAYAAPGDIFEGYIKKQIKKLHRKEHFLASKLEEPDVLKLAKESGVQIRNDGYFYAKDEGNVFVDKGITKVSGKPGRG